MNSYDSYQNGSMAMTEMEFQRLAQTVGTNIQKIVQNVSSMQRMNAQIGTAQDSQQFQQQLHQIQHYTGQLAKDTSSSLRDLNTVAGDNRQWRLQKERLHADFTGALNSFQAAQRSVAQKEKDAVNKAKAAKGLAGPNASGTKTDEADLLGLGGESKQQQLQQQQMMMQEEINIQELQERERGIRQLESDILDVNTIFKDLATMVHEQGEMVDSIEANVESTTIRVQEGTEQLRQAEHYKIKSRKKKMCLAGTGIIVLIILIAIIWGTN